MGFKADSYVKMLLGLLPSGIAWPKDPGTGIHSTVQALADELERVDARSDDLLRESDPRTTFEMLEDWERVVGIPDECTLVGATLQERREAIVSKLTTSGSLNAQFFIELAASLGFTVTIHEFRQFRAGLSRAGDPLSNGDWVYAWQVNAPLDTIKYFRAGSSLAGEALAKWGNEALECAISKRAPAGTIVLFSYGG